MAWSKIVKQKWQHTDQHLLSPNCINIHTCIKESCALRGKRRHATWLWSLIKRNKQKRRPEIIFGWRWEMKQKEKNWARLVLVAVIACLPLPHIHTHLYYAFLSTSQIDCSAKYIHAKLTAYFVYSNIDNLTMLDETSSTTFPTTKSAFNNSIIPVYEGGPHFVYWPLRVMRIFSLSGNPLLVATISIHIHLPLPVWITNHILNVFLYYLFSTI